MYIRREEPKLIVILALLNCCIHYDTEETAGHVVIVIFIVYCTGVVEGGTLLGDLHHIVDYCLLVLTHSIFIVKFTVISP